ncbi:methyltransferase-like protein 2 isoform X2 [Phalaenopsis equestris]|uniref:methyltransferase-like protein 2 isoform X2 n=1 Tax=Phalaenopsis equestris TaxID=78828 RepID=UPI0009E50648|nr:methyltransferase-like protein 2 isoform X2 [Phalaenopsis equestris]
MEGKKLSDELSLFLASGIYRLSGINAVFLDPVRLLNLSYSRHSISSSGYYCRTFHSSGQGRMENTAANHSSVLKKKKRKRRRHHDLNEKELVAERRHQELRPFLLKAHEALLSATELLAFLPNLVKDEKFSLDERELEAELKFIELGRLWQAPLYRISIPMEGSTENVQEEGCSDQGFNLIVIDPPWENGSAYQKAAYPTLPNRYLLYLPIKQLVHTEGALIVLWMTNRGKLRLFVEKELFPAWGVTDIRTSYWLKIKPDGSLLGDLGLIHHKPYEYLLLGYVNKKKIEPDSSQNLRENQILISIPGAYSRKPPLGKLLSDHVPGPKPSRCIELFARELLADWTSWGNEPLRFQDSRNFIEMKA